MEILEEGTAGGRFARARMMLERMETAYIAALRALLLLLATALLLYVVWLVASGLYAASRDATEVKEAPVAVTPAEIAALPDAAAATGGNTTAAVSDAAARTFYEGFTNRFFALYRTRYAPYRRSEDKPLDRAGFERRFVGAATRLRAIAAGELDLAADRRDLEDLLAAMQQATGQPQTIERLRRYKTAVRRRVARVVTGTRTETYCSYFGEYIGRCLLYDTRDVPYRRTVTEERLPSGVIGPADLLRAYQDRYAVLLQERREASKTAAEAERATRLAANADGAARLWRAVQTAGAFLILMFLFLLIALERHQRRRAMQGD